MVLTPEGAGHPARPVVAAAVDPRDRRDAAPPADRRRRVDRLARPVAALPRAVGLPDGSGLHLREGLRLGAARVPAGRRADRAAAGAVRRGEVARRRRVRPLAARRRRLHQHPALPQAARVRGRRGDPQRRPRGARRAGQGDRARRRPHHRPRQPRLALAPAPTARAALAARLAARSGCDREHCPAQHPLHDLRMPGPTLVLVDDSDSLALDALHGIEDVARPRADGRRAVRRSTARRKGWGSVLVVAADRARLRRMASAVPLLGQCKAVACWLTDAPAPWVLVPRPEWPPLAHLAAREAGDRGVLDRRPLRLRRPRPARRDGDGAPGRRPRRHHPRRARRGVRRPPRRARPRRPRACCCPTWPAPATPSATCRPTSSSPAAAATWPTHHVIDRAPTVVTDPGPEPVDERVFNPIGFRKDWDHPVVDLSRLLQSAGPGHRGRRRRAPAPSRACASPPTLRTADLLALAIVRRAARDASGVARRGAAAGAPRSTPRSTSTTPLRREEHSLAVRRAAFDHHSTLAWRSALATRAGVRHVGAAAGQRAAGHQAARDARLRAAPGRPPAGRRGRAGARRPRLRARPRRRTPCARRPAAPGAHLRRVGRSSATCSPPRRGPRRARCCSRSTTTTGTPPTPSTTC